MDKCTVKVIKAVKEVTRASSMAPVLQQANGAFGLDDALEKAAQTIHDQV